MLMIVRRPLDYVLVTSVTVRFRDFPLATSIGKASNQCVAYRGLPLNTVRGALEWHLRCLLDTGCHDGWE